MPLRPDEVAQLSHLLDQALELDGAERETWLLELERSLPDVGRRLRAMVQRANTLATESLPRLPRVDSDEAVAAAGDRVGPYRLVREVGRGGMGSVWLAERADGAFERKVALKLPRMTWSRGLAKRMTREREIGALLEHPNIARLYDAGVDQQGRPFIAYEYIVGQPLDRYCSDRSLDLRSKLRLFVQVVRAVSFAHSRLVLHRDIKPSNMLVDAEGRIHLLDFGIAKLLDDTASDLTQEQGRLMTLCYAAPEQILGRPVGVAADIYALGVVLYELLTAVLPYSAKRNTAAAMEEAILAGDAPLASSRATNRHLARQLRGDLDAILGKVIKREADQRYPTADAFATDIERYLDGRPIIARPDTALYRLRKALVRNRVPVAAVSVVVVVAVLGAVSTWMQGLRTAAEAERTRLATAFVSELFRMNALQEPARGDVMVPSDGRPPTDRGIDLIEAKLQGQPELQAQLYAAAARVYVDLGIDRKATRYASRQLDSLRAQKADKAKIAAALMLLAEAALAADRDSEAEKYARQAIELLPASDDRAPDALALLARTLIRQDQAKQQEAARTVKQGQAVLAAQKRAKSVAGAWLKYLEASLLRLENKFDTAKPLFDAAIVEAAESEGPGSLAAARFKLSLARFLMTLNRREEGRAYARQAITDLEQAGGMNRVHASLASADLQLVQLDVGATTFAEAIAVLDEASQFMRSPGSGAPAESVAELDFMRARAYMIHGDFDLAGPLAKASAAVMLQATQSARKEWSVMVFLGDGAMHMGDHESADKYLRQALALRGKFGRADHPYAAVEWANVAFNLSMAGRDAEAEAFLARAPKFQSVQGSAIAAVYEEIIPRALARVHMNAGDAERARTVLPHSGMDGYVDSSILNSYYGLRGEVRCASGEYVSGLFDLSTSIHALVASTGPDHPWLARTRAVAGLCALAHGKRTMAAELADASRKAFAAQPNVSPYFKEPLRHLERQLARKPK